MVEPLWKQIFRPVPITLSNLTNLSFIGLGKNSFTGRVLQDFGRMQNLFFIGLSGNYLVGDINFMSTLVNCSSLQVIDFGYSGFTGSLPESIANLSTGLKRIGLQHNPITGTIPAGITNLVSLIILDMSGCKLTGALPQDMGKLQNLQSISLNSNRLTGRIPNFGNASRLTELNLQDNKFEGSIPGNLGNCLSLLNLNVSSNELRGTLDEMLFQGPAQLIKLDLPHNILEGPIPTEVSMQVRLVELRLSNNQFSGMIPFSFASLASLEEVDFSQNNLSGPVPTFFSRFYSLHYLNLSYNNFEGSIPTNAVFANSSAVLLTGNNKLCGGIPALKLPKCVGKDTENSERRTMSHALWSIIPIISALIGTSAVSTGLYLACRKKKTPLSSSSVMGIAFQKVSYNMLIMATDCFSLENLLGAGSFGSVYKGILDGKTVAVKVLNMQHRSASKSFLAECNTLRNIRHRNLLGIITACSSTDFQENDFRALVYEFKPNGCLERWLHGIRKMNLLQRVNIALDVAHALDYLHNETQTPVVHCDLKPSNILLDNDMVAHVGDFGLAKFLTEPQHPNESCTTGIRGSVGYAAPEYGLGSEASTHGDLYSYGILLLELMTGKRPTDNMFKEENNLHMYARRALPDKVLQIVDPQLKDDETTEEAHSRIATQDAPEIRVKCIVSMITAGVACSHHSPYDRMKITDVITALRAARCNLLDARNRHNPPRRGRNIPSE